MPEISVIVPVYKVQQYLQQCVDSILAQTFEDFDLILVDDGSPDDCGSICDKYAEIDKRIHVIHQQNGGLSAARNAGIDWSYQHSSSKWLTFIDSDDWVEIRYLEVLYNVALKCNVDVSICTYHKISTRNQEDLDAGLDESGTKWKTEDFYVRYRENATVAWGKLYNKQLFSTFRYPTGKLHEDEFLTYQILFRRDNIGITKEKLYYYFINEKGIMQSQNINKRLDALEAYMQQIDYFDSNCFDKAKKSSVYSYIGVICFWINEVKGNGSKTISEKNRLKSLQKELKRGLKIYKEQVPFDKCRWAYAVAYPWPVKCYEFVERVLHKVKKVWKLLLSA